MQNERIFADFVARLQEWMCGELPIQDTPESEAQFNGLAVELFGLQYEHNPAYQRICRARNVAPEQVKHWKEVPFVPVVAFKEHEMSSIPPGERTLVFHSSGTTGQKPSRHFHSAASLQVYEASLLPWFKRWFLPANHTPAGLRFLFLTPEAASAQHSSLVHMFETIRTQHAQAGFLFAGQTGADGSWEIDNAAAIKFLEQAIQEHQPVAVMGTAFNFVHFLDALSNTGKRLRLPAGSRVMETGGYKGRSREMSKLELHAWICEMLGLTRSDIVCEYGMSELSSQAYDQVAGQRQLQVSGSGSQFEETGLFHFPPWTRVQMISPETGREVGDGEPGIIRVFDLANVFSVAPLQTEDLAIRHGNGFQLLGRATEAEPRGCSLMSGGGN
ncbi:MAG: putative acyl protein synthase/acyl-CoA reductase-like protein [Verrucomicrobiales bacterium]|nr:putative acyl protein synthase/acyl-CoA reductase-like protein [Verrucomicrobiales bacterium]